MITTEDSAFESCPVRYTREQTRVKQLHASAEATWMRVLWLMLYCISTGSFPGGSVVTEQPVISGSLCFTVERFTVCAMIRKSVKCVAISIDAQQPDNELLTELAQGLLESPLLAAQLPPVPSRPA